MISDHRKWSSDDLAALDALLGDLGSGDPDDGRLVALAELQTAREELRVADEELRAQHEQLEALLLEREQASSQRAWIASLLPLPILATTVDGGITSANAAAAALTGVPLDRLVGKPLAAFVAADDRRALRSTTASAHGAPVRLRVTVTPRHGEPVPADLVVTARAASDGPEELVWTVIVREPRATRQGEHDATRLATAFAELCALPAAGAPVQAVATRVAHIALAAVPAARWVSVNLGSPAAPELIATTAEEAARADGVQVRLGRGPCVEAFETVRTVVADDLVHDGRWPRLTTAFVDLGVAQVLSTPLHDESGVIGGLNLYGPDGSGLDGSQVPFAEAFAAGATAVMRGVRHQDHLREVADQLSQAMASRAVIEQAKGIVMAHKGCTEEEAFAHLATASQHQNVKLRELARGLVERAVAARR